MSVCGACRSQRPDGGRGARLGVAWRTGAINPGTVTTIDAALRQLQASPRPLGIETL